MRDWEGIRDLYHPDARLVRTGVDEDGAVFATVLSFDEYIDDVEKKLSGVQFSEVEIAHDVTIVGNVARLASVYAYELEAADQRRTGRGVNFFTMIFDGKVWRVMSIVWDNERGGVAIPGHLLAQQDG